MTAGVPLVEVRDLSKTFDVSPPWINRVVERSPRGCQCAPAPTRPGAGFFDGQNGLQRFSGVREQLSK